MKGRLKNHLCPPKKFFLYLGFMCFVFLLSIPSGHAAQKPQNTLISVSVLNGTIYDVFKQIETQSDYRFFYDNSEVSNNQKISVNVESESVNEILNEVANKAHLAYKISNKQIHVSKGETKASTNLVSQQQSGRKVTGTIKDKAGEPLIGVSVSVKGASIGTATDLDGSFTINVPNDNTTLVITYVGYTSQEVKTGNKSDITIVLDEDNKMLDEVVVVGYGTQKKVNLTGSVASINFEEQSLSRPVTNVSTALAGLSSGVQVMQGSGKPGDDGATIRVRGVGTLNNSDPLVIIDGMEGTLDAVNPQDIESISVLKDAASSAIYGSRAANGVILVTTKKGKQGRLNVNYTGRISFAKPTNLIEAVTNYADYMQWINESFTNIGQSAHFSQNTIDLWREKTKDPNGFNENGVPNYVAYPNTNWQDAIFENNIINDHNVSVNGGSEKIRFMLSAGYLDNPGLVENTGVKRYSMRANLEADVTNWLTVGTRTFASMEDRDPGDFDNANNFLRATTPGVYPKWKGKYGFPEAPEESATANSIFAFLNAVDGNRKKSRFNTTMYSKVTFMKGLAWDFNLNYQRRWDEDRTWTHAVEKIRFSDGKVMSPATAPSQMTTSFNDYSNYSYTLENLLRYNTTIAKDHDLGALAGYQEYYYYEQTNSGTKKGLIDESVHVPGAGTEMISIGGSSIDQATRSFFGRINYAYKSRYLFEANLRYDASSRYHKKHRWGVFPSFSGAWRITEEPFMQGTRDFMDNLKLRLSWGKLGNTGGKDVGNYEYQSTYGLVNYGFGGLQTPGLAITNIANTLLSWESTAVTNLGIDAAFLNNRLTFEMDMYNKFTDGILYRPNIYLTMGIKTPPRLNIAEVTNKGLEMTIGWKDQIAGTGINYSVSGNFAYNHNEVTKYKGEYHAGWTVDANGNKVYQSNIGDVSTGGVSRVVEGKQMNEYYLRSPYKGSGTYFNSDGSVNINGGPKDGMIRTEKDMEWIKAMIAAGYTFMPNKTVGKDKIWYGDYIYADANGDGIYGNSFDNKFQGTSDQPKYNFGMQFSASWKGFDIFMNWAGAAGFKLYWAPTTGYNSTGTRVGVGLGKDIANNHYFFDPENPSDSRTNIGAKYPRLTAGESGSQNTEASTLFLYNANYLKLKNLTIGYTLPKHISKRILAENLRVYMSGENLWNITSFPGQDPELGSTPQYTSVKQFAFGVNVTF
jgi:TonB-linked SusC/RagA family outer membrane protein